MAGARLPPALLDNLHEAGLFRLLLPRSSNGIETDPLTFFHVIETVARADGSNAWCLSQAGGCAMSAAYLDLPVAHAIFGNDPRAVLAWGPGPKVRAIECEGGYKVTGVWAFASVIARHLGQQTVDRGHFYFGAVQGMREGRAAMRGQADVIQLAKIPTRP